MKMHMVKFAFSRVDGFLSIYLKILQHSCYPINFPSCSNKFLTYTLSIYLAIIRGVFKTLSNIQDKALCAIFAKHFILDI